MERDLALLKIAADKSHFGSLDPGPAPARLTETMSVYSFGFTAEGDEANVAVAVKRGAVVSIRRSAPDENGWIRVDAVPSEGHVGGPVVDSSGRLVGICRQAVKDDRETVLTPRGDVKSFVEVALKGQLPKLATMKATTRKVAATDEPNAPKMTEPKNLLGGVRLLNASWGVLVEGGEPLLDTVDVLDTVAKLLEEGTVFEVEERLFPERTTRLRLALHLTFQAGAEIVDVQLPLRSQARLTEPSEELAAREEAVYVDSAVWMIDRTFNPAFEDESRDLTTLVREKSRTNRGCRVSVIDLPELRFGRPKVMSARVKLGKRQLELRIGEPGMVKVSDAKK